MYGINLNPLLPVRTSPSEQAEMSTQLLFGELVTIQEVEEKWLFIQNEYDGYTGWIDKKMLTWLEENEFNFFSANKPVLLFPPITSCFVVEAKESLWLPAGSFIHCYNVEEAQAALINHVYNIPADSIIKSGARPASGHLIVSTAKSFLNAPYLWGGKSILGMDCSGLVQLCFSICGIQLPRDASQQIEAGEIVGFLQEAQVGDLAFFENEEGRIIHVGIFIDNSTIIHASGKVKIERIDNIGIKSKDTGNYSHRLRLIKRIL